MSEHSMSNMAINNESFLDVVVPSFLRLIRKIIGVPERPTYSSPRQHELYRAHQTIRMAANYGDSYEEIAARIRWESAQYKLFRQNPKPIGKVALRIKCLDSAQAAEVQSGVNQPLEGLYQRSSNFVLEFMLHDEEKVPMFAIARTYSDWLGCKEFDLGNQTFYVKMVEAKRGYVQVKAGFKAKPGFILH